MSLELPMNINAVSVLLACTDSSGATRLPIPANVRLARNITLYNAGPSPALVRVGGATDTATYPTSAGAQGTVIGPEGYLTVEKTDANASYLIGVCATSGTASVIVQLGNGV